MDLDQLLRAAVDCGASDLHLKAGAHPFVRVGGKLSPLPATLRLSPEETASLAARLLTEEQRKLLLHQQREMDVSFQVKDLGRFRASVFSQRGTVSIVFRVIPPNVPSIADLNLPPILEKLCQETRGLILVTGTTGSGKSTALASMIDRMNERRVLHILTIEDPIEFFHTDKSSLITQREIRRDSESFGLALRSALRQDPDVIMVGEIRDPETMETALHAAETGHLVLSTLHTTDAAETIHRVIALFPPRQQSQIRILFSSVLKAIVSLRLLRRDSSKERLPAAEVLINTEYIRNCIMDPERTDDVRSALAAGSSQYGMQSFDQALLQHYEQKRISLEEALLHATNPEELKLRIGGVVSSTEAIDVR